MSGFRLNNTANWLRVPAEYVALRDRCVNAVNAWYAMRDTCTGEQARAAEQELAVCMNLSQIAQGQAHEAQKVLIDTKAYNKESESWQAEHSAYEVAEATRVPEGERTKEWMQDYLQRRNTLRSKYPLVVRSFDLNDAQRTFGWYVYNGRYSKHEGLSWFLCEAWADSVHKQSLTELLAKSS